MTLDVRRPSLQEKVMRTVRFATTNHGKASSLQRICLPYGIRIDPVELKLSEPQTANLKAIAEEKTREAFHILVLPVIAQDSGFFLPEWNDFPGPFVKFALKTMGLEGFLTLNRARPGRCEFRECLGYMDETLQEPIFFESAVRGSLSDEPRGVLPPDAWSELYLIFIPEGHSKTVAEMSPEERNCWRRTRGTDSATKFAAWLYSQT